MTGGTAEIPHPYLSTVKKFDQRGEEIEEAYFDETGKPITNKNGIGRWTAKYEGANPAAVTYFDQHGAPIPVQVYVSAVFPGGQANEVGLLGDVLVSYDGKPVRTPAELKTDTPGVALRELIISRNGRRTSLKVKPGRIGIQTEARAVPVPAETHGVMK